MFCQVKFLKGWQEPLWYKLNSPLNILCDKKNLILAFCPFRKKEQIGLVVEFQSNLPNNAKKFNIREINNLWIINNENFLSFIKQISLLFGVSQENFFKRLINFFAIDVQQDQNINDSFLIKKLTEKSNISFSNEQSLVLKEILLILKKDQFTPILLHGVTGSGKSFVYLGAIEKVLKQNKSVLFLLPEIGLAKKFFTFFKTYLPLTINIFAKYSGSSKKDLIELRYAIFHKSPILLIGVHQPIFFPIENLGLIIIDEEHDSSFVEKKEPFLDTRQLAILKAKIEQIPIILGSATPSTSTYYKSQKDPWKYLTMKSRFLDKLPTIYLKQLNFKQKDSWFNPFLKEKIASVLAGGNQVLLYLNRRGFFTTAKCKGCLSILTCPNCTVSLTLHQLNDQAPCFECHYCGFVKKQLETACQTCHKVGQTFLLHGTGIEKIANKLSKEFLSAKLLLAQSSTSRKKNWDADLQSFSEGEYDILLGTKTISKGLHFPKLKFVGVLIADLDFAFPVYNAKEQAIQQILQVCGRAGGTGEAWIQTFDPSLFDGVLNEDQYNIFLEKELTNRKTLGYPPFSKIIFIQTKDGCEMMAKEKINNCCIAIKKIIFEQRFDCQILGPTKSLLEKLKNEYFWELLLKVYDVKVVAKLLTMLSHLKNELEFDFWIDN